MSRSWIGGVLLLALVVFGATTSAKPPDLPSFQKVDCKESPESQRVSEVPVEGEGEIATKSAEQEKTAKNLKEKLQEPVSIDFNATSLRQVVADLQAWLDIRITVDHRALQEEGVDMRCPITFQCEGLSVNFSLNLLLKQAGLVYVVKDDHLLITTPSHGCKRVTKTYFIGDVASDIKVGEGQDPIQDGLVKLIQDAIKPKSWNALGGAGTVDYFPLGQSLVINQTPDVHEQVAELLEAVRRLKKSEYTCPYLKSKEKKAAAEFRERLAPPAEVFEATPLDVLLKLSKAHRLYERAEQLRKKGDMEEASRCFERVRELCPGSRYDRMASTRLEEIKTGATATEETGGEEQEPLEQPKPEVQPIPSLPPVDPGVVDALDRVLIKAGEPVK